MQTNRTAGYFTLTLDNELEHKWKFVQGFIDELKELVPWRDREYDQKTKVWTIKDEYYQRVFELHQKHFVPQNQLGLFGEMNTGHGSV